MTSITPTNTLRSSASNAFNAPLIIVSGPSGAGKTTLIQRLLAHRRERLHLSVSATTRPPRLGEKKDADYHFWTMEQFQAGINSGAFLEFAVVHGNYYGTLRREVDLPRQQGVGVVLDIDVQGAAQVRPVYPEHLSIFIRTSENLFVQRLRQRGTEDESAIARRLDSARLELARINEYQHVVINDDLEQAVGALLQLVDQEFVKYALPPTTT